MALEEGRIPAGFEDAEAATKALLGIAATDIDDEEMMGLLKDAASSLEGELVPDTSVLKASIAAQEQKIRDMQGEMMAAAGNAATAAAFMADFQEQSKKLQDMKAELKKCEGADSGSRQKALGVLFVAREMLKAARNARTEVAPFVAAAGSSPLVDVLFSPKLAGSAKRPRSPSPVEEPPAKIPATTTTFKPSITVSKTAVRAEPPPAQRTYVAQLRTPDTGFTMSEGPIIPPAVPPMPPPPAAPMSGIASKVLDL